MRDQVLGAARTAVMVDRAATHGDLHQTFGQLAAVWSARIGIALTPAQVAIMLTDLKGCRAWLNPDHADNWVDMAGYAACGAELAAAVSPTAQGATMSTGPVGPFGKITPWPIVVDDVGGTGG